MEVSAVILAGGKSSRMGGRPKGELMYGGQTILEHTIGELEGLTEDLMISYGADKGRTYEGCRIVWDEFLERGPIGGLLSGLKNSREEVVLVAACDMPFLQMEFYLYLLEQAGGRWYDGIVPVTDGRIQPLAAIYRKTIRGVLEEQIHKEVYRLRDALDRLEILYVEITEEKHRKMLQNINTIAAFEKIKEQEN